MAGVKGAQFHANGFRDWFWLRPLRSFIFAKILWDPHYDVDRSGFWLVAGRRPVYGPWADAWH